MLVEHSNTMRDDCIYILHTQSQMGIVYTTSPVQPVDNTETTITVVFPETEYKFSPRQCKTVQPVDESEVMIIVVFPNSTYTFIKTDHIEEYEPQEM